MGFKAQHAPGYRPLPAFLRDLRSDAGLTQRQLAAKLRKPQSWVYNAENELRRVDVAEFVQWSEACGVEPRSAFGRFLKLIEKR